MITLAGASELNQVRSLLKEWLDSTHQPEEEDGQQVTRFLTQLVENHQLHEVEPLLHLIIRFVIQLLPI